MARPIDKLFSQEQISEKALKKASITLLHGDAKEVLKALPPESIQCIITSPPYWGTRDYGVNGQIGMEADLRLYLDHLAIVFEAAWRVLKSDGVMWLNVGDVYVSGNRKYRAPDTKYPQRAMAARPRTPVGLKEKDLIGIPWRIAFLLQERGWYLRTEIIWNKSNSMPESVRDRPSRCHEYLFLLSKSPNYHFVKCEMDKCPGIKRTIWSIATARSQAAGHHAAFPVDLVTPCIKASTKKGDFVLDPFCGTGTVGVVAEAVKRRFVGIELNRRFLSAAKRRIGLEATILQISKPLNVKAVQKIDPDIFPVQRLKAKVNIKRK